MSDTYEEVKKIVVELLGVDEADSLDLVELIMGFEDKFGAEISDDDAQTITTVGDAVKYIDGHSAKAA